MRYATLKFTEPHRQPKRDHRTDTPDSVLCFRDGHMHPDRYPVRITAWIY